jgi:glycosyltransferase involved in cell wall biosynthesis
VHVLAGATQSTPLRCTEHDGVTVYRFRAEGALMRGLQRLDAFKLWWTKNRLENALSMYRGLTTLLRQQHYDLIEMPECGAEGLLINQFLPVPTLIKFHSPARLIMPYYDVQRTDIMLCSLAERLAMRRATALSACSQFLAGEVKMHLGIKPPIRVIPNGIDLDLFDAVPQVHFRRQFNIPQDHLLILFSGRMEPRKGIHLCKDIVASILERYPVAFVFAGQDLFQAMSDTVLPFLQTQKLRGSVHYVGKLDLTTVRSALRQTDIFFLPSLWENCPYACLEAMAAGRAIVSSDQGGMPELIRDGDNGLLARNGDKASFIDRLTCLIEDDALRERLGMSARRTVEASLTDLHIARASAQYYVECVHRRS